MDKVVWRKDKIDFLGTWLDRWRIIRLNFWYMSKGVWRNNTIDFRGTWLHGWRNDKLDLKLIYGGYRTMTKPRAEYMYVDWFLNALSVLLPN